MSDFVIELVGGERDGAALSVDTLPLVYLVPMRTTLSLADMRPDRPNESMVEVMTYEQMFDPAMGRPSLNDEGRYRYRYAGVRRC